jgi:hypothetical protein
MLKKLLGIYQMLYKVLDVQWHIGHQYEMLKFPFVEWSWLAQYKRRTYARHLRGDLADSFKVALYYERGYYDLAILHLDQECLSPSEWNRGKGVVYRDMNQVIDDIPKVVIMHGSPHNPEAGEPHNNPAWLKNKLREVVGSNYLVVNSHQAAAEWEIGTPIIHGLDANEWFDLPKRPRVVTTLSAGGMDSYYDRSFLDEVRRLLRNNDILHCQIGKDFIPRNWTQYREFLGSSLVYFNPTFASPMPRSRTEAMFSGCCVVTTPHHDATTFIEHAANGFLVDRDPRQVALLLEQLISAPAVAIAVGQNGKRTAHEKFGWARFAKDWEHVLESVTS